MTTANLGKIKLLAKKNYFNYEIVLNNSILYDILVFVGKVISTASIPGGMAELVDAADLKSVDFNRSWEFKSPYPHLKVVCKKYKLCLYDSVHSILEKAIVVLIFFTLHLDWIVNHQIKK